MVRFFRGFGFVGIIIILVRSVGVRDVDSILFCFKRLVWSRFFFFRRVGITSVFGFCGIMLVLRFLDRGKSFFGDVGIGVGGGWGGYLLIMFVFGR